MESGKIHSGFTQNWIKEMLANGVEPSPAIEIASLVEEELRTLESRIGSLQDSNQSAVRP